MNPIEKLKMHTPNLTDENIAKIVALFPDCVTETRDENGKPKTAIDFDLLRQALSGSLVEGAQERYQLNWPGKREALLTANAPIAKTLRPVRAESVDFDRTENLFIEGDNLDALKLLQETYLGKVKMIYIDPPYNTGKDFVYEDDFAENTEDYLIRSNQKDEDGNRMEVNSESNGRFHSNWLSMMYPRLKLARNLLADDGVIFISIDDNEQANLKRLCDEVFGEKNFIDTLIVIRSANGMGSKEGYSTNHDFILVYKKDFTSENAFKGVQPSKEYKQKFNKEDKYGKYKIDGIFRKKGQGAKRTDSPGCFYPIYANPKTGEVSLDFSEELIEIIPKLPNGEDGRWVWSKEFAKTRLFRLYASEGGTVYVKDYWDSNIRQKPRSILDKSSYLTDIATNELIKLFDSKVFSTPKPTTLVYDLIDNCLGENDIILDFFAGSGTTAHAVMQLNAEDGGNRRFICVQLPEKTDEKSEAFKAGYPTIAEITKERIRRAGQKILEGDIHENWRKDIGFRVLKTDTSNMADVYYNPTETVQKLQEMQNAGKGQDGQEIQGELELIENIKFDRTPEDLLFQVMLDWSVDLALPIEVKNIMGREVFFVDENSLIACFDKNVDNDFITALTKYQPLRVVFRDDCFKDDSAKINTSQIFQQYSEGTEVKTI